MRNDQRTILRSRLVEAMKDLQEDRRVQLVAMVEACGFDARDFPRDGIRRAGSGVILERYVRDPFGCISWCEKRRGALTEEIEIHPPGHLIPNWLPRD